MTYAAQEIEQEVGEVLELYVFETNVQDFHYTSGNQRVELAGDTYEPLAIRRSNPKREGQEQRVQPLTIRTPDTLPIAGRYVNSVPPQSDRIQILRAHRNATGVTETPAGTIQLPATGAHQVIFTGTISTIRFDGGTAVISAVSRNAVFDRQIPKRTCRGLCNHVLYDGFCQVAAAPFTHTVTVDSVAGNTIVVTGVPAIGASAPNGLIDAAFFIGGTVDQLSSGDARMVQTLAYDVSTQAIGLLLPFENLTAGDTLELKAGCDHTLPTCIAKFANGRRYGGFPFVPNRNPFSTARLF